MENYADERLTGFCINCGGSTETREHVPSKVLLDDPYPANLPVELACSDCNSSFSLDEEYLACVLECVIAGSTDPEKLGRTKIRKILERKPALASRIEAGKKLHEGTTHFNIEEQRIKQIVLKLARGHAAHELSEPQLEEPATIDFLPLDLLGATDRAAFENVASTGHSCWSEVGSRAMQRVITGDDIVNGWVVVQKERYRYSAVYNGEVIVRIILSEYLACEVIWDG